MPHCTPSGYATEIEEDLMKKATKWKVSGKDDWQPWMNDKENFLERNKKNFFFNFFWLNLMTDTFSQTLETSSDLNWKVTKWNYNELKFRSRILLFDEGYRFVQKCKSKLIVRIRIKFYQHFTWSFCASWFVVDFDT